MDTFFFCVCAFQRRESFTCLISAGNEAQNISVCYKENHLLIKIKLDLSKTDLIVRVAQDTTIHSHCEVSVGNVITENGSLQMSHFNIHFQTGYSYKMP